MATLKDIAKRAGVSIKTVSRVINGESPIRPETRRRVQSVIDEMNYVPSHAARMMRTRRSGVIGFMTDVVVSTPYSVDITRGVQEGLQNAGKTMIIANTERDPAREARYLNMFREHRVEGVIFATMFHRQLSSLPAAQAPLVLLNCFHDDWQGPTILPDDYAGGRAAAEHLLDHGHRCIGVVSLNPIIPATGLRMRALVDAMRERGLTLDEELVQPGFVGPVVNETFRAFEAATEILRHPKPPTAILCGNDQIAAQVYCAAWALGVRIPDDLSVVGFDDLKLITETMRPAMSTVALPYQEMGRLAVRQLMDAIKDKVSPGRTLVPCPLRARDSVVDFSHA